MDKYSLIIHIHNRKKNPSRPGKKCLVNVKSDKKAALVVSSHYCTYDCFQMERTQKKKEREGRTEKRLLCDGGNTLVVELNCIRNPKWDHERLPSAKGAPPAGMWTRDPHRPGEGSGLVPALLTCTSKWTGKGSTGWDCSVNTSPSAF